MHIKLRTTIHVLKQHKRRRSWLAGAMVLVFILSIVLYAGRADAASQGPLGAATAADKSGNGGTVTWSNVANVTASDGSYASASLPVSSFSHNIMVTNFGFTVPSTATVNGIVTEVQESATTDPSAKVIDKVVRPVKAGAVVGTNQALTSTWPSANSFVTYGSVSNLWGTTWTPGDINNTGFGIVVSAQNVLVSGSGVTLTANIDYIRVTVYYSTGTGSTYGQASYRLFNNMDASSGATFAEAWGGTGSETGYSTAQTSDGGYVVTGSTTSFGAGGTDMFIAKFDSLGGISWSRTWGSAGTDIGYAVVQTSDGGYAVAGDTTSFGAGSDDAFLAKFDSSGNLSWSRTWGGAGTDVARGLVQTSDGGYALAGNTTSFGAGSDDAFLAKFDSSGNLSWSRTWGGLTADSATGLVQTSDGGYALTGNTTSFGAGGGDVFLAKFDSSGNLSWSRTWGGSGNDTSNALVQTSDGGYALTGSTASFGAGNGDMFLAKFDSSGNLSWSRTWGGASPDTGYDIVQTSDGGYAVTGSTNNFGVGNGDLFLVKYDQNGNFSWSKTWGGSSGAELGYALVQTSDGGYALTGSTASYGAGGTDTLLIKYDSSGNVSGCTTSNCRTEGTNYTATHESDTVGGGSDYTSTVKKDTVGGGSDYTSTVKKDTVGGGSDYTSTTDTDGTQYASTVDVGGADYTSTTTVVVAIATSIDVGTPLAAQNTAATLSSDGNPFRLRMDIAITNSQLGVDGASLKLQYAPMTTSCDAGFTNTPSSAYQDVTATSAVRYYDNPNAASGISLITDANDPTDGSNTLVYETYQEKGASIFTNPAAIPAGEDGVWDFALTTYQTLQNTAYCLRVVQSDGTTLSSYTASGGGSAVAEIILPGSSYKEGSYRFFAPSGSSVGAPWTQQSAPYDVPVAGTQFRLRMLVDVSGSGTALGAQSFKLQYSLRGSDNVCDTSFSGESYADVTTTTPVYYYDGTGNSGDTVAANANDPTDGGMTNVPETYQEANNFSNSAAILYAGQGGLWDFSLAIKQGTMPFQDYCLRVVKADGSLLGSYSSVVDLSHGPASLAARLRQGEWFSRAGVRQNLFLNSN